MASAELAKIKLTCFKPDVYEPSDDSFLLADTLVQLSKEWTKGWPQVCIEIGCGSGYVLCSLALTLQKLGAAPVHLIATDLNPSAAQATAATLAAHGIPHAADVIVTDLITSLEPHLEGLVDLLLFNPPYVPTPDEEVAEGGIAAAWAGGYRGRRVVDRLLPLVPQLLSPTGQMLLVAVSDNDIEDLLAVMKESGFNGRVAAKRSADEELLYVLHFWRHTEGSDRRLPR